MARQVPEDRKVACITGGITCIKKYSGGRRRANRTKDVVKYLTDKKLTLQLSDKTGRFVVMSFEQHIKKAREAAGQNFVAKESPEESHWLVQAAGTR